MIKEPTYSFSFTATTLRLEDFRGVMQLLQDKSGSNTINELMEDFSSRKLRTNRRILQEYIKRYESLTHPQIDLFMRTGSQEQAQIAFLACAKTYKYISDFVVEVVRDKYLVFDLEIIEGDYRSFFNSKCDAYPELNDFAESTLKKVKQHLYKIIEEGGLIDSIRTRTIQTQFLSDELKRVIVNDNPNWLKIFLLSDHDIESELKK